MLPVFAALLVALSLRVLVCAPLPDRVELAGEAMGTTWSVVLNAPGLSREGRTNAGRAAAARLEAVNAAMSTWLEDSEVSRFNAHASSEPFPLSPATLRVLALAEDVSERTGGAFDVTVRPLVAAWGFGAGARVPGQAPDAAELAALRDDVGYQLLQLDASAGHASKRRPRLEIDLSAIAKGFAVDEVAHGLEELGLGDFLVEVGGELRAVGERPGGGAWRLAIERPEPDGRAVQAVVELSGLAMATSGDYRSFYEQGGERLTHIIDPRRGRPVRHALASVTVVHEDAALADAWATALTVLGPVEGEQAAAANDIAAYLISRLGDGSYTVRSTPGFPEVRLPGTAAGDDAGSNP